MTSTLPDSVQAEGMVKAIFIPTMAGAAPTAVELAAGTDFTMYLLPDWDGPTPAQNTGDDRRFGSRRTFDRLGRVKYTINPLMYTYDPQALISAPVNKVYQALAAGNTGLVVMGYGIDNAIAIAAGKKVDVFPVKCGVQGKQARAGDAEFGPLTVMQTLVVTGVEKIDATVL